MLRNYLRVALRNLRRQRGYALINIFGLAAGLACCFLIVLFIQHERSFDRFHNEAERIHRLIYATGEDEQRYASTAAGLATPIREGIPEVKEIVRMEQNRVPYLRLPDGEVRTAGPVTFTDENFFHVFSFPLLRGQPGDVLADPFSLVLTETTARILFGDADPVGQQLSWNDQFDVTVTGIAADPPQNSTLQFGMVVSFRLITELGGSNVMDDLTNWDYYTYILLQPGADRVMVEEKAQAIVRELFGEETNYRPILQPLAAIHFDTEVMFDYASVRNPSYLIVFGAIGLLILLLSCINFTNLATARAMQRAQEVGIRKSLGAKRGQLVGQFLGESVLLALVATAGAWGLVVLVAPVFNEAINSTAGVHLLQPSLLVTLLAIGLLAGVLAGSYPAFYLSGFRPALVLKGKMFADGGGSRLRRSLVVFQFAATAFMLVGTLTVYRQLGYIQAHDLGFDQEHVITVNTPNPLWRNYDAFRQELLTSPHIISVSRGNVPGRIGTNRGYNWPAQERDDEQGRAFWTAIADPDHLETLGIEVIAGRGFTYSEADEDDAYILNEAALRLLEWTPEEAVGQPFRAWDRPMGRVVGVTSDFHFQSLHSAVEPVVINYKPQWLGSIAVRLAPGHLPTALADVRTHWETFAPGYTFEYTFLDEAFGQLYHTEQQLGRLFGLFAALAMLIACLGLFGLAAYATERRTKELGIRKILGARPRQLVALVSREFVVLVAIATALATPLGWIAMERWLEGFAYRITLGPGVFLVVGTIVLLLALATVAGQALRAAYADPVKALRTD